MHILIDAFRRWAGQKGSGPAAHFIVACSGGLDSVVLCYLCFKTNTLFSIAHCNFGLRGAESDRDEAFVKRLGERYNVPVYVTHFDTMEYGLLKKISVQEAARDLRYAWFERLRVEKKATAVLLAHHASDNVETALLALFRGTGLHGLTGMPQETTQAKCLRPLLSYTRDELHTYATENDLKWVEDSSNASNKYTRNFFRNTIIPAVQEKFPQAEENVLDTIERLKKTELLYNKFVHGLLKKLLVTNGNTTKIPIRKLLQYAETSLPFEVFRLFGFSEKQVPHILSLAESQSGSYTQNQTHRVIRHNKWFIITPLHVPQTDILVIENSEAVVLLPEGTLKIIQKEISNAPLNTSPLVAQLDGKLISFPLVMRRWKKGDYFYPLGLRKKKKLARFFIDLKLAAPEKEAIWVIEWDKRIIWVVGYRIDDRFKITETTKTVLQLTFKPETS